MLKLIKLSVLVAGSAATLALAGPVAAAPDKTTNFDVTLVGTGCGTARTDCGVGGGGSCLCFAAYWNFAGRANLSPPLGSFMFTGLYEEGYFPAEPVDDFLTYSGPFTYYRNLRVTFKSANGDILVMSSRFSSAAAPVSTLADGGTVTATWTVDEAMSTGRYARFTGSGAYTLSGSIQDGYEVFTLGLTGALTFD